MISRRELVKVLRVHVALSNVKTGVTQAALDKLDERPSMFGFSFSRKKLVEDRDTLGREHELGPIAHAEAVSNGGSVGGIGLKPNRERKGSVFMSATGGLCLADSRTAGARKSEQKRSASPTPPSLSSTVQTLPTKSQRIAHKLMANLARPKAIVDLSEYIDKQPYTVRPQVEPPPPPVTSTGGWKGCD